MSRLIKFQEIQEPEKSLQQISEAMRKPRTIEFKVVRDSQGFISTIIAKEIIHED